VIPRRPRGAVTRPGPGRRLPAVVLGLALAVASLLATAVPASAHVLPTSTVVLDVRSDGIDAALRIPLDDLEAASGIDLGARDAQALSAQEPAVEGYLAEHFQPTSSPGGSWTVDLADLAIETSEELGTGQYQALTATAHLTPPAGGDPRSFDLGYDVVVHRVVTHIVLVSVRSDWAAGSLGSAREIGMIQLDTVSGDVVPLHVDLGAGSPWRGLVSMIALGADHIREGVDHQLFLLTLLLPAPVLLAGRRWAGAASPRRAVRRIATITLAFTVGHSVTLALGALGLPVPQRPVEALIAVSILVAAVHAARPIFPGREALIAGGFGLVHGMAFSATLTELQLTGGQLAVSLLGFNIGIELMQLAVVALVLPPLIVLAHTRAYPPLRFLAAALTAVAAIGWLATRLGQPNGVADAADGLLHWAPYVVAALWIPALILLVRSSARGRSGRRLPMSPVLFSCDPVVTRGGMPWPVGGARSGRW
jgi:hypothetical protein